MTNNAALTQTRGARWGWALLLVVSALVVLNGVALFFISSSPATFEQDTGVAYQEVAAEFPTVAEQVQREGQTIATLLAAIGLMAAAASWSGFRNGGRWAWTVTGILLLLLTYFVLRFLLVDGRADIGGLYLVLGFLALVGQVLTSRQALA